MFSWNRALELQKLIVPSDLFSLKSDSNLTNMEIFVDLLNESFSTSASTEWSISQTDLTQLWSRISLWWVEGSLLVRDSCLQRLPTFSNKTTRCFLFPKKECDLESQPANQSHVPPTQLQKGTVSRTFCLISLDPPLSSGLLVTPQFCTPPPSFSPFVFKEVKEHTGLNTNPGDSLPGFKSWLCYTSTGKLLSLSPPIPFCKTMKKVLMILVVGLLWESNGLIHMQSI